MLHADHSEELSGLRSEHETQCAKPLRRAAQRFEAASRLDGEGKHAIGGEGPPSLTMEHREHEKDDKKDGDTYTGGGDSGAHPRGDGGADGNDQKKRDLGNPFSKLIEGHQRNGTR